MSKKLEPILINYKRKKITIRPSLISPPEKLHSAPLFSDAAIIKSVADQWERGTEKGYAYSLKSARL